MAKTLIEEPVWLSDFQGGTCKSPYTELLYRLGERWMLLILSWLRISTECNPPVVNRQMGC